MTREEAKELLPTIHAFADGKRTIQDWIKDTWKEKKYTPFGELSQSPLKPDSDTDLSRPEKRVRLRRQNTNHLRDK